MTENEAIKITGNNVTEKEINLKTLYQLVEKFNKGHWGDIQLFEDEENRYSTVIEKVIEEIQQYRAIGTVEDIEKGIRQSEEEFDMLMEYRKIGTIEEFKALKEKNTKKRFNIFESRGMRQFVCGCCDRPILTTDNYCSFCGQKIDWK